MTTNKRPLRLAPAAVFRVWQNRERIELEAAGVFSALATGLSQVWGQADPVATLARTACADELRHAERCRRILGFSPHFLPRLKANTDGVLGPQTLSVADKVLYGCVAVGCVTETLSTALLVEMHRLAAPGIIRDTIHEILSDEIGHSRIGWAELARASRQRDVSWLSDSIPAMIREAIFSDVGPMLTAKEGRLDLSRWGILPPKRAGELMEQAIAEIIIPGLREFGISTALRSRPESVTA